jgi:hypothetical protein
VRPVVLVATGRLVGVTVPGEVVNRVEHREGISEAQEIDQRHQRRARVPHPDAHAATPPLESDARQRAHRVGVAPGRAPHVAHDVRAPGRRDREVRDEQADTVDVASTAHRHDEHVLVGARRRSTRRIGPHVRCSSTAGQRVAGSVWTTERRAGSHRGSPGRRRRVRRRHVLGPTAAPASATRSAHHVRRRRSLLRVSRRSKYARLTSQNR